MKIEDRRDTEYKGNLISCANCGKNIGKIDKNKLYIINHKDGKRSEIIIEINHDKGGNFKIESSCCGSSFGKGLKKLTATYCVKKPKQK